MKSFVIILIVAGTLVTALLLPDLILKKRLYHYVSNLMLLFMNVEKMPGNDLSTGLKNLKYLLEKELYNILRIEHPVKRR